MSEVVNSTGALGIHNIWLISKTFTALHENKQKPNLQPATVRLKSHSGHGIEVFGSWEVDYVIGYYSHKNTAP